MTDMGRRSTGNHARQIAGLDGIDGGTTDTDLVVWILGVDSTGSHGTVFTAGRLGTDGAWFHIGSSVKSDFNTIFSGLGDHLSCGVTDGNVCHRFGFNRDWFFIITIFHWIILHDGFCLCSADQ